MARVPRPFPALVCNAPNRGAERWSLQSVDLLYVLRLGTFGFGGPIALAGWTQRDRVERRRWIRIPTVFIALATWLAILLAGVEGLLVHRG